MKVEALGSSTVSADLARAAAWMSKQIEIAVTSAELSPPQYRVLSFLDEGAAESAAVARRLAVRPPTVTSVMDGLVSKGFVERRHSQTDRRRVEHVLTDEGRDALQRADEAVGERLALIASSLDDEADTARALDALGVWREAMVGYRQRMARP